MSSTVWPSTIRAVLPFFNRRQVVQDVSEHYSAPVLPFTFHHRPAHIVRQRAVADHPRSGLTTASVIPACCWRESSVSVNLDSRQKHAGMTLPSVNLAARHATQAFGHDVTWQRAPTIGPATAPTASAPSPRAGLQSPLKSSTRLRRERWPTRVHPIYPAPVPCSTRHCPRRAGRRSRGR